MTLAAVLTLTTTLAAVSESAIPVYTVTGMLAILLIRVLVVYSKASDRAEVIAASRVKEVVAQLERSRADHAALREEWQEERAEKDARIRQLEQDLQRCWEGKARSGND